MINPVDKKHTQKWTRHDLINHGVDITLDDTDGWNQRAQTIDPLQYRKTITPTYNTYNDQSWDGAKTSHGMVRIATTLNPPMMRAATTRQIKATSTDCTLFAATTTKAYSLNSYATTIGKDDLHPGAVLTGIPMLTLKDMTSSRYAAHNEDLGVIHIAQPKHTTPMTGDVRWLIIPLAKGKADADSAPQRGKPFARSQQTSGSTKLYPQ